MKHSTQGGSNLLLVLVIAMLLILLTTAILLFSLLSTKLSTQSVQIQTVEFAAEGAMLATISELKTEDWPTTLPYEDTYTLGDTQINRKVTDTSGPDGPSRLVEITANRNGVVRKLEGVFETTITIEPGTPSPSPVPGANDYIKDESEIDFYEITKFNNPITIPAHYTLIVKDHYTGGIHYVYNDSDNPIQTDTDKYTKMRRWMCRGHCPEFSYIHPNNDFKELEIKAGDIIQASAIAILDDDFDTRRVQIIISGKVKFECEQGITAPACTYEVKPEDIAGLANPVATLHTQDSVLVYFPEGEDSFVFEPGEIEKQSFNFYYYEVEPDPVE